MDIFQKITTLNLPEDEYVIVGGGILVALGLLEWDDDIDICVTPEIFNSFKSQGWDERTWKDKQVLKHDVYDVGVGFGKWNLEELQDDAVKINGIQFISLNKLLVWKQEIGRPKDTQHIALINEHLARK
jgi:hypothetical protein